MVRRRGEEGYTALAALLLVAAALALAAIALDAGRGARLAASTGNNEEAARAIAEVGLERTRAYLGQVLAAQIDLDQALDPKLDDTCAAGDPNTADDNLPPFADGTAFTGGPGNRKWLQVPSGGGAYLVRIDDDDDDQLNPNGPTFGNHAATGCNEGLVALGAGVQDVVRDTNRTAVVTVVGMYPGTDITRALAVKTLRATVGPAPAFGVAAGGDIHMSPASDNLDSSVISSGNIDVGGSISGTAKSGGTCTGSASCVQNASIPPMPRVDPWDIANAPSAAISGVGTNFYYAAYGGGGPVLYQWNYGAPNCADPRAWSRICYPDPGGGSADTLVDGAGHLCTSCWTAVAPQPPDKIVVGGQPVWDVNPAAPWGACTSTDPDPYPADSAGPYWDAHRPPNAKFTWHSTTPFGATPAVSGTPAGIWVIAGDVDFTNSTACTDVASIDALGDITLHTGHTNVNLIPAAPRQYILLAGRDLQLHGGNGGINSSCPAVPAAVMVHEQLEFQSGHDSIDAQVVVENAATCSPTVTGPEAILGHGNDQVNVTFPPPIGIGPSGVLLDFQESAF